MSALRVLAAALCALTTLPASGAGQQPSPTPPPAGISEEDLPGDRSLVPSTDPAAPSPAAAPTDELGKLEADAQLEYADGNLQRALELYLALAARHPRADDRARLRITAAWLSFQLADRAAAANQLVSALYEAPAAPFRAELFDPEFAALFQDALRDAVDRRARDAAERTALAVDAIRSGRFEEARRGLESALTLAPDHPDILYNLALVDLRQGRSDAALAGFERVLALERTRPEGLARELKSQALNNVAVLYFARGDYEVARTAIEDALKLVPNDPRGWFNLGVTLQKLGQIEPGYSALRKARDLDRRDVDIARALALADIDRRDWVEAVALLVEGTRERPEDPELWLHLGRAQRGLGNADGALLSFRTAAELDPANRAGIAVAASLLRTEVLRERSDAAGAAEAAGRVVALRADHVDGWMLLGLARHDLGDAAGAREALERARLLAPRRADVAQNLGSILLAQRDLAAAETAFRAVLELDPGNVEVRGVLDRLVAQRTAPVPSGRGAGRRAPPQLGAKLSVADYAPLGIQGLVVDSVVPDGAAADAGLLVGDLILRVDGKPPGSSEGLRSRAVARKEGVVLDLLRSGKPVQIRLKLE